MRQATLGSASNTHPKTDARKEKCIPTLDTPHIMEASEKIARSQAGLFWLPAQAGWVS